MRSIISRNVEKSSLNMPRRDQSNRIEYREARAKDFVRNRNSDNVKKELLFSMCRQLAILEQGNGMCLDGSEQVDDNLMGRMKAGEEKEEPIKYRTSGQFEEDEFSSSHVMIEKIEASGHKSRWTQYYATCAFGISWMIKGCLLNFVLATKKSMSEDSSLNLTEKGSAWIEITTPVGAITGSLISCFLLPRFGNKMTQFFFVDPIFIIGFITTALSPSEKQVIIGRILCGLAVGVANASVVIFVCEIAEPCRRAALVSMLPFMLGIGLLGIVLLSYSHSWRQISLYCAELSVLSMFVCLPCSDSPTWLLSRGRKEDALKSMKFYRGNLAANDAELKQLKAFVRRDKKAKETWRHMVKKQNKYGLQMTLGAILLHELGGINAVTFYAGDLIVDDVTNHYHVKMIHIVMGTIFILGYAIAVLTSDMMGRKRSLLISSMILGLAMFGLASFTFIGTHLAHQKIAGFSLFFIILYIIGFTLGYGSVVWVVTGEVFTPSLKYKGVAMGVALKWGIQLLIIFLFRIPAVKSDPVGLFEMFSIINILGIFFGLYWIKEMTKKSLKEIQDLLQICYQEEILEKSIDFL